MKKYERELGIEESKGKKEMCERERENGKEEQRRRH